MFLRNNNLHIRRFEFKYLVPDRNLDKIRNSIWDFVEVDKYAKKINSNSYQVKSLYLDDFNYSSYFEKLAGIKYRRKLRIRAYQNSVTDNSRVFLEIKRKDDVIVFKDRIETTLAEIRKYIEGTRYDLLKKDSNVDSRARFFNAFRRAGLVNTTLISYKREAYFDRLNSSFRLTLDQDLSALKTCGIDFDSSGADSVVPGYAVVEAKFNRIMPYWFGMIIRSQNLERISASKYCISLERCGIVRRSNLPVPAWI